MGDSNLKFMRRALFLAEKFASQAHPNPKVGAVLVKNGKVVGEGVTQPYGGDHAEVEALRKAGSQARGSTLVVTLEPCSHYGKTPPCAEALVRAGVKKVVAAMGDPFPKVSGGGFALLRKAGIEVKVGLLKKEAEKLNEIFLSSLKRGRPKVILKAALSLDGKIATVTGKSKWISGERSRKKAQELRAQADAILVGSGTVRADDPSLEVRLPGFHRLDGRPFRVVLDSKLQTSTRARLYNIREGGPKTLVFTSLQASPARRKALEKKGVSVFPVPLRGKMLSLRAVLKRLHSLEVRHLLVEGGGEVHSSFLQEKLADEAALFISPKILGGKAPTWVGGRGVENPNQSPYLSETRVEQLGQDYFLTGKVEY